jgi:toxin ParE1/3/4
LIWTNLLLALARSMKNRWRLIWSPAAKEDLLNIWHYFARVASPEIAEKVLHEIEFASNRLTDEPLRWRLRMDIMPKLQGGLRSVLAHPYTVFYQLADDDVRIVRVLHERQNVYAILSERFGARSRDSAIGRDRPLGRGRTL